MTDPRLPDDDAFGWILRVASGSGCGDLQRPGVTIIHFRTDAERQLQQMAQSTKSLGDDIERVVSELAPIAEASGFYIGLPK